MSHHPFSIVAVLMGGLTLAGVFQRPLARWYRKVRRRRGGVYLWRVDHHLNRTRRVNGYVGETVSFYLRSRQHMGVSRFDPATGVAVKTGTIKVPTQPWSDLNPKMYKVIKLPWWLCWKWVLRPLETLVMLCTWPVYNDAKNHWNPRRISKALAKSQRAARERGGYANQLQVFAAHALRRVFVAGVLVVICLGVFTWNLYR